MSESNLATMPIGGTGIQLHHEWEKQKELIMRTVAIGLDEDQFRLFMYVAKARNLDPLQRQIHAVVRNTKEGDKWVPKMTIQTGIDGYRSIANRTGTYMPSDKEPRVDGAGGLDLRVTVWVKKFHEKSGQWMEFNATAWYREYVQTYKDNNGKQIPNSMWAKMPINQLTKCAEALALRKGWPEELGQIYTDEEMGQADSSFAQPADTRPSQQNKTQRDVGTLRQSKEPNRGHGNEGTERAGTTQPEMCAECRQINGHAADCKQAKKAAGNTDGKKPSARDQWPTRAGHDPKKHIGFDDALQLFKLETNLGIDEAEMKSFLDKNWKIQNRHTIPQAKFQEILGKMATQYGKNSAAENPDSEPEESESAEDTGERNTSTDGLFDQGGKGWKDPG